MNIKVLLIIFMLSIVSNINASNYKFTYFAPTGTQTDDAECISTSGCSVDIDESNNAIYLSIEDSDQYFEIVNKKIYKRYPYYTVSGNNNRIIYFWVHPCNCYNVSGRRNIYIDKYSKNSMEFYFRTNQIIKIQDMNLESKIKQWSKAQKIIAAIFTPIFSIVPAVGFSVLTAISFSVISFILTENWDDRYEDGFYIFFSIVYTIMITFYIEMKIFKYY